MRSNRVLLLGALLSVISWRSAVASAAQVTAPLRLDTNLGAVAPVPLIAPGFHLVSYQGFALSLLAPGAAVAYAPIPVPVLRPAFLSVDSAPEERGQVLALQGLTGVAGRLSEDRGGRDGRPVLDVFFEASQAQYVAPAFSGFPEPRLPVGYLPLPITVQETNYSCGTASALSVLRYWQAYEGDESSLYELLGTRPKDGTPPDNIARGLSKLGLSAVLKSDMTLDDLRVALRRGDSVILDIQAWREDEDTPWSQRWEDGHYVVLAGMDEHYIYLMDPSTPKRYTYMPLPEFLERWHDYEDRDGWIQRNIQTGIVAHGTKPLSQPAEPPLPPEPIK